MITDERRNAAEAALLGQIATDARTISAVSRRAIRLQAAGDHVEAVTAMMAVSSEFVRLGGLFRAFLALRLAPPAGGIDLADPAND